MEYIRGYPQIDTLELVCMNWQLCVLLLFIYPHSLPSQLKNAAGGLNYLHSKHLVHGDLRAVCPTCIRDGASYSCMTRRNIFLWG